MNKKIKPKILAIDDRKANLLALEAVLEDLECDLYLATSGQAGLKLVLEHEFALALVDVQMPGMDGFEVAKLILGIPKSKYLPIIFITAFNEHQELKFKGYNAGGVDFLFKPLDPKILTSKVGIFLDLYCSKQFIENQKVELEEKVEALKEAKNAAEVATQAKSDFLSIMSHEIRTPMNAIMGFTQLVLKTELSSKQSEFLNTIQISAQNLLVIINDILDFSKIEAGKLSLESVEFSLESILGDMAHQEVPKAQNKGLELLFYIEPNVPNNLLGDPLRLGQILLNLLSNAIKFTDRGQVVLTVKTEKSTGADAIIHFAIQDTGIGLSEQQVSKLFHPFTQADSSTTREYGGTGLGLSICQRLVEIMGGRLWVESEQGKGSTFHFTARFKVIKESNQKYILPPELEGLRILLVDDNPVALNIMKRLLEIKRFQVTGFTNPEEALREMEQAEEGQAYDLAILDWRLPKMKGTDLAKRIQQHPGLPEKPKIIIVSASSQEEVDKSTEGGWSGTFLSKPVSASVLFNTILSLFQSQKPKAKLIKKKSIYESDQIKQITGAHILLVEDNLINQELALEILKGAGILARVANNGREALEMLQTETFDGVLMDVQMPEMDGLTATCEIRKQKKFKKLPIIAMTANALAKDRQAALKVGMNDYIAKPIREHDLFSIMAKWIKPSGLIAQQPAEKSKPPDAEGAPEIPALEGIDVEMGLIIAQDNPALYRRLLGMFRDSQR
ncbi:MAG: response regulator, partial [Nitrospinae bacterium]|nr:response regulator [Nitrospinota bacterium]